MGHRTLAIMTLSAALALVGCAGSGGSTSTPGGSNGTGTGAGTTIPQTTQRAAVQSALSSLNVSTQLAKHRDANGNWTLLSARRMPRAGERATMDQACSNGFAIVNGVYTYYYDASCTRLREQDAYAINFSTGTGTAAITYYDLGGTVSGFDTWRLTLGASLITFTGSHAVNASAPPLSSFGLTCTGSQPFTTATCSGAYVSTLTGGAAMIGAVDNLTANFTVPNGGGSVIAYNGNSTSYAGAAGALSPIAGGNAWSILGGGVVDTITGNGSLTFTSFGQVSSGSVTLNDSQYNATLTATATPTGYIGAFIQNGTTIATYTVDLNGNGTIAYGNGATGTVSGFNVLS